MNTVRRSDVLPSGFANEYSTAFSRRRSTLKVNPSLGDDSIVQVVNELSTSSAIYLRGMLNSG
jgi:hypothetical protein